MVPTAEARPNPFSPTSTFAVLPTTMEPNRGDLPPPVELAGAPPKFKEYPWTWRGMWSPGNLGWMNERARELWSEKRDEIETGYRNGFFARANKLGLQIVEPATAAFFVRPTVVGFGPAQGSPGLDNKYDYRLLMIIRIGDRERVFDEIRVIAASGRDAAEVTATYLQRRTQGQEPRHQAVFFNDAM
jgi:hypothetical protein